MPESTYPRGDGKRAPGTARTQNHQHAPDDAALLVLFFEKRRAQLLWDAQRVTKSAEEAEDIVQESLLKAWRNLQQFRGESQIGTWLRAIVKNTAREWLRNRGSKVHLPLETQRNDDEDPTVLELPDPRLDPEEWCERREIEEILYSELGTLTYLSRRAIELCALEEKSLRDAARTLNVGVVAVKSRMFRGRRLLERGICQRTGGREYCRLP
ncbi:MAG: RNA polymerase sigma factor [Acidobacteriota bacterium]